MTVLAIPGRDIVHQAFVQPQLKSIVIHGLTTSVPEMLKLLK